MSKILAIIPARSGSKGLANKNIRLLNNKPLIAYTIEAAIESDIFDEIIVSTDSQDYADIALKYGATVPFFRPEFLSGDAVSIHDVLADVLEKLKNIGRTFNYLMILQPTSPLRTSDDIKNAMDLLLDKKANAVISLCETEHSPLYAGLIPDDLKIDGFIKKDVSYRRQDLPKYYRLNGAIYLGKVDYYLKYRDFYKENCYAYIMDKTRSVDIDDEYDFMIAEMMMKYL